VYKSEWRAVAWHIITKDETSGIEVPDLDRKLQRYQEKFETLLDLISIYGVVVDEKNPF